MSDQNGAYPPNGNGLPEMSPDELWEAFNREPVSSRRKPRYENGYENGQAESFARTQAPPVPSPVYSFSQRPSFVPPPVSFGPSVSEQLYDQQRVRELEAHRRAMVYRQHVQPLPPVPGVQPLQGMGAASCPSPRKPFLWGFLAGALAATALWSLSGRWK